MGWWGSTTDALVAVGTDVVVARQCSQSLIELPNEQVAVGIDAVPPSAADPSLRQGILPHPTATDGTA